MTAKISVSIILPVTDETFSLRQTLDIIASTCGDEIKEFIIVIYKKTTEESLKVIQQLQKDYGQKIIVHTQKLPFLGGAVREGFDLSTGTHVIMMASDLETDPNLVPKLIDEEKKDPEMIVTATRWAKGGGFEGYNPLKFFLNYAFQKFFSILYGTSLTDMTYGYRIFPTPLVHSIHWEELRHPFLFETILKPLRLGVRVKEIPGVWAVRKEGESQNTFFRNFEYFPIGLKVRFTEKNKLLKSK
ncbi:MAG TPA: glycosyltransferase family 2 protein [Acidobacteriota bacterium]|nr:glycosyltransferase family 2 protein [Acidobacteriota bacterium]